MYTPLVGEQKKRKNRWVLFFPALFLFVLCFQHSRAGFFTSFLNEDPVGPTKEQALFVVCLQHDNPGQKITHEKCRLAQKGGQATFVTIDMQKKGKPLMPIAKKDLTSQTLYDEVISSNAMVKLGVRQKVKFIFYFATHGGRPKEGKCEGTLGGYPYSEIFDAFLNFKDKNPDSLMVTSACFSTYILDSAAYKKEPFPVITMRHHAISRGEGVTDLETGEASLQTLAWHSIPDLLSRRTGFPDFISKRWKQKEWDDYYTAVLTMTNPRALQEFTMNIDTVQGGGGGGAPTETRSWTLQSPAPGESFVDWNIEPDFFCITKIEKVDTSPAVKTITIDLKIPEQFNGKKNSLNREPTVSLTLYDDDAKRMDEDEDIDAKPNTKGEDPGEKIFAWVDSWTPNGEDKQAVMKYRAAKKQDVGTVIFTFCWPIAQFLEVEARLNQD